jgi:hypothetical protein
MHEATINTYRDPQQEEDTPLVAVPEQKKISTKQIIILAVALVNGSLYFFVAS